jgi:hypothetical protein
MEHALADYTAAEDALRAFTDRNFGRLCAMCARWTLLAARVNAESAPPARQRGVPAEAVEWRLSSWVTNCCNANHALEAMEEDSLAGIVASREEGREWWEHVRRTESAPCAALTDQGCALKHGRPELCNRYFCEAVRDYLWHIGGEKQGAKLAERLDDLQRRWTRIYAAYERAAADSAKGGWVNPGRLRTTSGLDDFLKLLERFDAEITQCARPVSAELLTEKLFKVTGDQSVYEPFFQSETAAIGGEIRRPAE